MPASIVSPSIRWQNYTYDAFGELSGQTGTTENTYRFAGEQWDANLGEYYLRQRYYDANTGRFLRRDDYEGEMPSPMTLHKYVYTHADPVNYTDPSGYSRVGGDGNFVHNYIGIDFILKSSNFDVAQGRRFDSSLRRYTINKLLGELGRNTVNVIGNNNRPDLVDFDNHVLYEIKPRDSNEDAAGQLRRYLTLINLQLEPIDPIWTPGTATQYTPPPRFVVPPAKVIRVEPPDNGIITYYQENDYTNNLLAVTAVTTVMAVLMAELKEALGRRSAIFGF